MLVITRKILERILVFLDEGTLLRLLAEVRAMPPDSRTGKKRIFLTLTTLEVRSGQVKHGFEGPGFVVCHREEIAERVFAEEEAEKKAADAKQKAKSAT